jgi:hypothetical protein
MSSNREFSYPGQEYEYDTPLVTPMHPVAYLREIDPGTPNACWVVCAKGDPGAIPVFRR